VNKITICLATIFSLSTLGASAAEFPPATAQPKAEQEISLVQASAPTNAAPATQAEPQPVTEGAQEVLTEQPPAGTEYPERLSQEQQQMQQSLLEQSPRDQSAKATEFPRKTNYGSGQSAEQGQGTSAQSQSGQQTKSGQLVETMTTAQAVEQMVAPLTPDEIRKVSGLRDGVSRQIATPEVATVPRTSSITVDLSPGASVPVVRVAAGRPTYIIFQDITGAPWPLATAPINAQEKKFYAGWFSGTPTVYIQPRAAYGNGDIGVLLKELPVPINIVLANGETGSKSKSREYDSTIYLRIPKRGPMAPTHSITSVSKIGLYDQDLQSLLDGVPPSQAIKLKTDNPRIAVWKMGKKMYVRTQLSTKSMYSKTLSSADGTHVFEMELSPFVTLLDGDKTLTVKVDF
jgi:intracellular multiplication protein IcmK